MADGGHWEKGSILYYDQYIHLMGPMKSGENIIFHFVYPT